MQCGCSVKASILRSNFCYYCYKQKSKGTGLSGEQISTEHKYYVFWCKKLSIHLWEHTNQQLHCKPYPYSHSCDLGQKPSLGPAHTAIVLQHPSWLLRARQNESQFKYGNTANECQLKTLALFSSLQMFSINFLPKCEQKLLQTRPHLCNSSKAKNVTRKKRHTELRDFEQESKIIWFEIQILPPHKATTKQLCFPSPHLLVCLQLLTSVPLTSSPFLLREENEQALSQEDG